MARYIDADIALEKMKNWHTQERLMDCVRDTPTADVVEVVRCKDCEYFNGKIDVLCERCGDIDEPCGGCHYTGGCTYDDGYCHHGKRRKEDG